MTRPRVLLVDDEPSILRSTALLLDDMGFEVVPVEDHAGVVQKALEARPAVILQDVRMPGLDLDRLVRAMRADPRLASVPIILFSASMDLDEVADRIGVAGRLEKPFKPQDLAQALERAMKAAP